MFYFVCFRYTKNLFEYRVDRPHIVCTRGSSRACVGRSIGTEKRDGNKTKQRTSYCFLHMFVSCFSIFVYFYFCKNVKAGGCTGSGRSAFSQPKFQDRMNRSPSPEVYKNVS